MENQFSEKVWQGIQDHLFSIHIEDMKLLKAELGHVQIQLEVKSNNVNLYGYGHGGTLFALCDSASGMALYTYGVKNVTQQANIHYIKKAECGWITVDCQVVHKGRKTAVTEAKVYNEQNTLLCMASFTMYILEEVE